MLLATPGLSWFPARWTGDIGEPIPTALAGAQEIDGRNALRGLTAGAVEHSLAMQPTDWVGRNRHQPAEEATIPADIPCGAEAAQERPLGVNDALSHRTQSCSPDRCPAVRREPASRHRRESGKRKAKRKAGQVRYWQYGLAKSSPDLAILDLSRFRPLEAESGTGPGTGPILLNWAAPPTSERSSPGRGILISAHPSWATRGTIGRL